MEATDAERLCLQRRCPRNLQARYPWGGVVMKPKPPPGREDRQRRLMGPVLDVFDHLHGKGWVTLIGIVALIVLVVMSFWPGI